MRERGSRFRPPLDGLYIHENWESFKGRLRSFEPVWKERIDFAYDFAKDLYRSLPHRKSGREFFDHPRATALILLDECRIRDPRIIIGSLFHDAGEDTTAMGYYQGIPYSQGMNSIRMRLEPSFGKKVVDMIIALTKPKVDGIEIKDTEQATRIYFDKLAASPGALLIKMADRLHNLRDYVGLSVEDREKIIRETEGRYFELFEKAKGKYPKETEYLLNQMTDAIRVIRRSI